MDRSVERRYVTTDYFFALSQCLDGDRLARVADLAKGNTVELMAHPEQPLEREFLVSERFADILKGLETGTYADVPAGG